MIDAAAVVSAVEQVVVERPGGMDVSGSVVTVEGDRGLAGEALVLLGQGLPGRRAGMAGASVVATAMRMLWPLTADGLAALEHIEAQAGDPWLLVHESLMSRFGGDDDVSGWSASGQRGAARRRRQDRG